eukprot:TRINITY_DN10476_c0_g1_i4.p1 TRINITY_DN10476_c0_g1~~TRINITY_DN10476_c0_g1_i4.p1  ORF type:complete len:426 (-),score=39.07 TRINITY_DN10476_c0_g1_i4:65-1342(-)
MNNWFRLLVAWLLGLLSTPLVLFATLGRNAGLARLPYTLRDNTSFITTALSPGHGASAVPHRARILYLISTGAEAKHQGRIMGQWLSWGRRVGPQSKIVFYSHKSSTCLPVIVLEKCKQFPNNFALKEFLMWQHAIDHHLDEFEWFVKGDDDTFFVPPTLELYLGRDNPDEVHYRGRTMRTPKPRRLHFTSGGGGYALSRGVLRLLSSEPYPQWRTLNQKAWVAHTRANATVNCIRTFRSGPGDTMMAECLELYGVRPDDTRDAFFQERWSFMSLQLMVNNRVSGSGWLPKYLYYGYKDGSECCSNETVSFHYESAASMCAMDALLFNPEGRDLLGGPGQRNKSFGRIFRDAAVFEKQWSHVAWKTLSVFRKRRKAQCQLRAEQLSVLVPKGSEVRNVVESFLKNPEMVRVLQKMRRVVDHVLAG